MIRYKSFFSAFKMSVSFNNMQQRLILAEKNQKEENPGIESFFDRLILMTFGIPVFII